MCASVQLGAHPFFRSFMERAKVLGNNPVVEKGRNLKEDIRERWETTENPTVQRFQVSSVSHLESTRVQTPGVV